VDQGSHTADIAYHVWWPPGYERWYLADSTDVRQRVAFYPSNSIPEIVTDGRIYCFDSVYTCVLQALETRRQVASRLWMSMVTRPFADNDSLFMQVSIVADSAINANCRLYMAVTSIYDYWESPLGQTRFYSTMYRMYPDGMGRPFTHSGNPSDTSTYTAVFAVRDTGDVPMYLDNLKFTAWVQDTLTREVLQSQTSGLLSGVEPRIGNAPRTFEVSEAYPNPFNPTTSINLTLDRAGDVRLTVHDITGRQVADLLDSRVEAGIHRQEINARGWAAGVYFLRVETGNDHAVRKLLLLK
jgi:hypothetical protein